MRELGSSGHRKVMTIEMKRGTIYDRCNRELAISVEVESLYIHPQQIDTPVVIADKLAPVLKINKDRILAKLEKDAPFVWIKRKLTHEEVSYIKHLNIPSLGFIKEYKRFYPKKKLCAHVLGFAGMDNYGLEGIELYFDKELKGPINSIVLIRDANGRMIIDKRDIPFSSYSGYNLVLTIDEVIQYAAEIELKKACRQYNACDGCVIIIAPKTGEILAMAVYPTYDPNHFSRYPASYRRNRAIVDMFEPGSTFKTLITAALLEEDVLSPFEEFYCPGEIKVSDEQVIRCAHLHNKISFEDVIIHSCNVGIIQAAKRLSNYKLYSYIEAFGVTAPTGIELPGEEKGILKKPNKWSKVSAATIAIGQGVSVTPIQISMAIAALANDGILMKPLIVKTIKDDNNRIIKRYSPAPVRRVVSSNTARSITQLLKKVVERGTGVKAAIEGYEIAGKTGTAQKVVPGCKGYAPDKYVSSFIGYLPADNPEILITVIINEPKTKEYWGGKVAGPVFRKIAKRILPYLHILPEKELQDNTLLTYKK
jgi:cell division protein FtsI/penicillin-binding protein 2